MTTALFTDGWTFRRAGETAHDAGAAAARRHDRRDPLGRCRHRQPRRLLPGRRLSSTRRTGRCRPTPTSASTASSSRASTATPPCSLDGARSSALRQRLSRVRASARRASRRARPRASRSRSTTRRRRTAAGTPARASTARCGSRACPRRTSPVTASASSPGPSAATPRVDVEVHVDGALRRREPSSSSSRATATVAASRRAEVRRRSRPRRAHGPGRAPVVRGDPFLYDATVQLVTDAGIVDERAAPGRPAHRRGRRAARSAHQRQDGAAARHVRAPRQRHPRRGDLRRRRTPSRADPQGERLQRHPQLAQPALPRVPRRLRRARPVRHGRADRCLVPAQDRARHAPTASTSSGRTTPARWSRRTATALGHHVLDRQRDRRDRDRAGRRGRRAQLGAS